MQIVYDPARAYIENISVFELGCKIFLNFSLAVLMIPNVADQGASNGDGWVLCQHRSSMDEKDRVTPRKVKQDKNNRTGIFHRSLSGSSDQVQQPVASISDDRPATTCQIKRVINHKSATVFFFSSHWSTQPSSLFVQNSDESHPEQRSISTELDTGW